MKHTLVLNNLSAAQLMAVSAALFDEQFGTTHDTTQTCSGPCTQPEEVAAAEASEFGIEVMMAALHDPQYEMRTANSLADKLGPWANESDVKAELEEQGTSYFTKTRRSDGATLIGLVKEPAAVQAAPVEVPAPSSYIAKFDILMGLLKDPRFVWRTVATLVEKTGYRNQDEIEEALEGGGVNYDCYNRGSDGAPMITLYSRV